MRLKEHGLSVDQWMLVKSKLRPVADVAIGPAGVMRNLFDQFLFGGIFGKGDVVGPGQGF
jgi:hypothetical protein